MGKSTAKKPSARVTLRSLLDTGTKGMTFGPYKGAHTAHVRASQIRGMVKESGREWVVTVDAEKSTVRVAMPSAAPKRASRKAKAEVAATEPVAGE